MTLPYGVQRRGSPEHDGPTVLRVARLACPQVVSEGCSAPARNRLAVDLSHRVRVESEGRCGQVIVTMATGDLAFPWEFGGEDCLAIVHAPGPSEWLVVSPVHQVGRDEFLEALAIEVRALQCPSARYAITATGILFVNSASA